MEPLVNESSERTTKQLIIIRRHGMIIKAGSLTEPHNLWKSGTEAARGAEGAPAPPTACVIKELFFSLL
jgi:hypothetical protein